MTVIIIGKVFIIWVLILNLVLGVIVVSMNKSIKQLKSFDQNILILLIRFNK